MKQPTVFLATQLGTGNRYFFQTDIVPCLLEAGVKVVCIVPNPEEVTAELAARLPGVTVEKLRLDWQEETSAGRYRAVARFVGNTCVSYLRMNGMSRNMNLAVFRHVHEDTARRWRQGKKRYRYLLPSLRVAASLMQRSRLARRLFDRYLEARPAPVYHDDLFKKYDPDLVVVSSPGWWPGDAGMIREARGHEVPTVAVLVGWDHTSSKGLPGARPDRVRTWSEVQKQELIDGSDFEPQCIDVGGVAHFDFYKRRGFAMSREEHFARHHLDPARRLITFGCSFVGISSNVGMVRILADAVAQDRFDFPAQLLVRLHPTHFKKGGWQYEEARQEVRVYEQMARECPYVRLGYPDLMSKKVSMMTGVADMINLASLLRHSDVFVTLFSTMVLEAAFNDTPTVSVALDPPPDWQGVRWLSITQCLDWPTHERIIASGASTVALTSEALLDGVNAYLHRPELHADARRRFALQECAFLDDQSGRRIAAYIQQLALHPQARSVLGDNEREGRMDSWIL